MTYNPLAMFFKMGEKATGGDPNKQADFIYYMVWVLFIAFFWLFANNAYQLFFHKNLNAATWTLVGFAICGIQYFSLKGMYDQKKMRERLVIKQEEINVESMEEMLKGFTDKKKKSVNGKKNRKSIKSKQKV